MPFVKGTITIWGVAFLVVFLDSNPKLGLKKKGHARSQANVEGRFHEFRQISGLLGRPKTQNRMAKAEPGTQRGRESDGFGLFGVCRTSQRAQKQKALPQNTETSARPKKEGSSAKSKFPDCSMVQGELLSFSRDAELLKQPKNQATKAKPIQPIPVEPSCEHRLFYYYYVGC